MVDIESVDSLSGKVSVRSLTTLDGFIARVCEKVARGEREREREMK